MRYQGEPLAIVVAEDRHTAHKAAEAVAVDYERLDAVTDPRAAVAGDAPTLHDGYDEYVAYDWEFGDEDAVDEVFDDAAHTASVTYDEQRIIPNALEPRASVAEYDPGSEELHVQMSTQTPHSDRHALSGIIRHPNTRSTSKSPASAGDSGRRYTTTTWRRWCRGVRANSNGR